MVRLRSIGIVVAMLCSLLLIGINSSDAYEIVEFPSDTEVQTYGDYTYHMAELKTDVPYLWIEWYVDDKLVDIDRGDGVKTKSYFSPYGKIPGAVQGEKHTIEAFAAFTYVEDLENVDWDRIWDWEYAWRILSFMDSDSYKVRSFESVPSFANGILQTSWEKPRVTGVYGYAAHYFNGTTFVMEASAYANNGTEHDFAVASWFRQQKYTADGGVEWGKRDPPFNTPIVSVPLPAGQSYSDSANSWMIEYSLGRPIGRDETLYFDAHTHLQVHGVVQGKTIVDDWEADTTVLKFTEEHNP